MRMRALWPHATPLPRTPLPYPAGRHPTQHATPLPRTPLPYPAPARPSPPHTHTQVLRVPLDSLGRRWEVRPGELVASLEPSVGREVCASFRATPDAAYVVVPHAG